METGEAGVTPAAERRDPWVQLEHTYGWNDLVLGRREREQLRSVASKARTRDEAERAGGVRSGLTALFVGEGGTGKTMAAQIIAAELGRPVLQVDLEGVLGPDVEDPKQLIDRVFEAAAQMHAIIVFDGVRSFVGRRARPRIETSELLVRSQAYPGLVVFTWRPSGTIDLWLPEQVDFLVEFPFPAARARSEIWRRELPAGTELAEGDLRYLARSFRLSGGAIRRVCAEATEAASIAGVPLGAALLAPALAHEYGSGPVPEHTRVALAQLTATAPKTAERTGRRRAGAAVGDAAAEQAAQRAPRRSTSAPGAVRRTPQVKLPSLPRRTRDADRAGGIGRGWVVVGVGATLLAAAVGFVIAGGKSNSPQPVRFDQHATTGSMQVSYPSDWQPQSTAADPALGLTGQVGLGPSRGVPANLVIGRTQTSDASLLPRGLLDELPSTPVPQLVTLGHTEFYRYAALSPRGANGPEWVYAVPTTAGTILGVCSPHGASAGFTATCERVLATLHVASGSVLVPGPSPSYGAALDRVVGRLGSARAAEGARLRGAHDPRTVVAAADALSRSHAEAAAAIGRLDAGEASAANTALAEALKMTGDAYAALARAAAHRSTSGYRSARVALGRASRAVSVAYAGLGKFGYRVG
jgi:ATPase family associated with various cellular activities (AAA)